MIVACPNIACFQVELDAMNEMHSPIYIVAQHLKQSIDKSECLNKLIASNTPQITLPSRPITFSRGQLITTRTHVCVYNATMYELYTFVLLNCKSPFPLNKHTHFQRTLYYKLSPTIIYHHTIMPYTSIPYDLSY